MDTAARCGSPKENCNRTTGFSSSSLGNISNDGDCYASSASDGSVEHTISKPQKPTRLSRSESSISGMSEASREQSEEQIRTTGWALTIIDHPVFRAFMTCVILLNIAELGMSCDIRGTAWDSVWLKAEHCFIFAFAVEMIIKVLALRRAYFKDKSNMLDFVIAWAGILDMWFLRFFLETTVLSQLSLVRILRLLRVARIAKVLSVQSHLQVMAAGMFASLLSMFWIGILLALILYACAIACVECFGRSDFGPEYLPYFDNAMQFGNVPRAMLSLFNIVLLDEWTNIVRPIYDNEPSAVPFLIIFVVFTACGVLNIMVGTIVDKVQEARLNVNEMNLQRRRAEQMVAVENLAKIMGDLDNDADGRLSMAEVTLGRKNVEFRDVLDMLNLPKGFSIADLFTLLNRNNEEYIDGKVFTEGMFRLIFSDNFQHMCMLHQAIAELKGDVRQLHGETTIALEGISQSLAYETSKLRKQFSEQILRCELRDCKGSTSANDGTDAVAVTGGTWEHVSDSTQACSTAACAVLRQSGASGGHRVDADFLQIPTNQRHKGKPLATLDQACGSRSTRRRMPTADPAAPIKNQALSEAATHIHVGTWQPLEADVGNTYDNGIVHTIPQSEDKSDVPRLPPARSAAPQPTPPSTSVRLNTRDSIASSCTPDAASTTQGSDASLALRC